MDSKNIINDEIKKKFKILLNYDVPDKIVNHVREMMLSDNVISIDEAIKLFLVNLIEIYEIDIFDAFNE